MRCRVGAVQTGEEFVLKEHRTFVAVASVALLALVLPAVAHGADSYVDFETGVDGPTCGAIGSPCKSILTGIDNADVGDDIRVDETTGAYTYMGLNLGFGKSLIAEDFVAGDDNALAEPDTIIDGGNIAHRFGRSDRAGHQPRGQHHPGVPVPFYHLADLALKSTATVHRQHRRRGHGHRRWLPGACSEQRQHIDDRPRQHLRRPNAQPLPPRPVSASRAAPRPSISSNTFTDLNHGVQRRRRAT